MRLKEDRSIYYIVQYMPLTISEKNLADLFGQARFDPRLMEVVTEFVRDFWWSMNPQMLNHYLKKTKYPYSIKPALFVVHKECSFPSQEMKRDFEKWSERVSLGIKNPPLQVFYITDVLLGSYIMRREFEESIECFSRFNLFAKDIPFNKAMPKDVKTKEIMSEYKLDALEIKKSELARKIREAKFFNKLKNEDLIQKMGINRSYLSKILDCNLEGITLDYLTAKASSIEGVK